MKKRNSRYANRKRCFFSKVALDVLTSRNAGLADADAPAIETLEPRILLSANPVAELFKDDAQAVIQQPLSSASPDSPTPRNAYAAPTGSITYPNYPTWHLNGLVELRVDVADGSHSVREWRVNIVDVSTREVIRTVGAGDSSGNFALELDTTAFEDGQYCLQLEITDASNRGRTDNRLIEFDNAAPVVAITSPVVDGDCYGTVKVYGKVLDNSGSPGLMTWDLDLRNLDTGEVTTLCRNYRGQRGSADAPGLLTFFDPLMYPAGSYEFVLTVTDYAGNTTVAASTFNIVEPPVTPQSPVLSIVHNAEPVMSPGQRVDISVTADRGVQKMWLMVNGSRVELDSAGNASLALDVPGTYTVVAYAAAWNGMDVGKASFAFEVAATGDAEPPVVNLTHDAPPTLHPGRSVEFLVIATDNVGVASLELAVNGRPVPVGADGRASFVFDAPGVYEIVATAADAAGNTGTRTIRLEVVPLPDTEEPVVAITHDAPSIMHPGREVHFIVAAEDNIGVESLVFTVNGHAVSVDAAGNASYTFADVGVYEIMGVAVDAAGNRGVKTLRLEVVAVPDTEDPVVDIVCLAPSPIHPGQVVDFAVTATDNVGVESLTLTIDGRDVAVGPDGRASHVFTQAGIYEIRAVATDAAGNSGTLVMSVEVVSAADTEAPVVALDANTPSVVHPGQTVDFTVRASDNVGVESVVLFINGQPVALDAGGKASHAFAELGAYEIKAVATDAAGNAGTAVMTVTVVAEAAERDIEKPVVSLGHNLSSTTVKDGDVAAFTVSATDNTAVTGLTLAVNGAALALSPSGSAEYAFGGPGVYVVVAKAVDAAGNEATAIEVFTVPEIVDNTRPSVTITHDMANAWNMAVGNIVTFKLDWNDNIGVTDVTFILSGSVPDPERPGKQYTYTKDIVVDSDGNAVLLLDKAGTFTLEATVRDAAGNLGPTAMLSIRVLAGATAPSVSFGGRLGESGSESGRLEENTDVVASISGDVASWEVTLVNNRSGETVLLNSGTGAAGGVLGRIDVTSIENGSYSVRVAAVSSDGVMAERVKHVVVSSSVKLGNFELPFQDLALSVGGFNVQVNRVYDSLTAGYSGDFGHGWNLGTIPLQLSVNNPINLSNFLGASHGVMYGSPECGWTTDTVISIDIPDGSIAKFEVTMTARQPILIDHDAQPYTLGLVCVSGHKLSLSIENYSKCHEVGYMRSKKMGNTFYILNPSEANGYFNPTKVDRRQQITYHLTTEDGTTYLIDPATGKARGLIAADGRRLDMNADGYVAYDADGNVLEQIRFVRDEMGRISHIVDPSGGVIAYEYDANGDLVSMTNQGGQSTGYEYVDLPDAPGHYLQTIRDASGKAVLNVDYDFATGRINGITDADGNLTNVEYTLQNSVGVSVEKVTDASGLVTEAVMDKNGNVIRTVQHIPDSADPANPAKMSYLITLSDYDARGNLLGSARAFTVTAAELASLGADRLDYWPADLVWEETSTYDQHGHRLTSTDVYGRTTTYEYDVFGNVTKTTDPYGNVTSNAYDAMGRIEQSVDANGSVTAYTYDLKGQLTTITLTHPGHAPIVISRMVYDPQGRMVQMFDQYGTETTYIYDANGRQTQTGRFWTDPDTKVLHSDETFTTYNASGQVVRRVRNVDGALVSRTTYEYNASGQTTAEIDQYDLRTEYRYDARGQTVETRRQVKGSDGMIQWLVSRTVYDELGREIWSSDETLTANPDAALTCRATHTEYDILGRVIRTETRDNVTLAVAASGNDYTSSIVSAGARVAYEAQAYDGTGRTWWVENSHGVKTVYTYTPKGEVWYTTTDLDGDLSTTHDQTTVNVSEFDNQGQQTANILDREDGDLSTTRDQTRTEYVYDSKGRVVETIYGDGNRTKVSYDALGRKASETDQLGNTTYYEYDAMGRLTAVILPKAKHPKTGEMVHVRYEYEYDDRGNHTILRDNVYQTDASNPSTINRDDARVTSFTYDWQGRQTSRTLPDGLQEFTFYNGKGQTVRHVSFEGRVTVLEYDDQDRLVKKSYFSTEDAWNNGAGISGHTLTYTYDAYGRVIREVDSKQGTTETTYNSLGQVTRIDSSTGIINYEYDSVTGQVTRTWTGPNSASPITDIRNTYDKLGRLETVETYAREGQALLNPETAKYVYDVIGNLNKLLHANGIITDYNYDTLNRLKEVIHTHDNGTPDNTADDVVVEQFVYDYYANGNKSGETAKDKDGNTNTWDWDYDALGRLVEERHDNHDDSLSYKTDYMYDLVGNRLEKRTVSNGVDELIQSKFDENDRLLNEMKLIDDVEVEETVYDYQGTTEQRQKTVTDLLNSRINSTTKMTYNDQGRLSKIVIETYVDGSLSKIVTQEYEYDSSGIKVKQTEYTDDNADGIADSDKVTEYLNDAQNHTGYSQVIEEKVREDGGSEKVTTYTIGHDVLAQYDAVNGFLTLLTDGHGSTRAIADMLGTILQQYNYDAYGNAHGFDPAEALTNLLYSGEQFNPVSGLQYLRARWYNPQTGVFNRLDPFAGSKDLPQSFSKYAYSHSNPIMNSDPSGLSVLGVVLSYLAMVMSVSFSYHRISHAIGTRFFPVKKGLWFQAKWDEAYNKTQSMLYDSLRIGRGDDARANNIAYQIASTYAEALLHERIRGLGIENYMNLDLVGWKSNLFGPHFGTDYGCASVAKVFQKMFKRNKQWSEYVGYRDERSYYYQNSVLTYHNWVEIVTKPAGDRFVLTGWDTGTPSIVEKSKYKYKETFFDTHFS